MRTFDNTSVLIQTSLQKNGAKHSMYVLVFADKAANNVIIIWYRFYYYRGFKV